MHGVQLQQADDQVLEILGEVVCTAGLVLGVSAPKGCRLALGDGSVEWILVGLGCVEWWRLRNHNEQDDAECEQVDGGSNVGLALVDLRCHVVLRSEPGVQEARAVSAFHRTGEAEVRNLQIKVVVEQKILRLQISVSDAIRVAVVEALKRLLEVVTGDGLGEGSRRSDEVEDLALLGNAQHNVVDLTLALGLLVKVSTRLDLL